MDETIPQLVRRDMTAQERNERSGETTVYTCPECGGTLWQVDHQGLVQFNCHVGHTYAPEALLGQMSEELEAGSAVAVRAPAPRWAPASIGASWHYQMLTTLWCRPLAGT
jgi:hypothetical protein